MKAKKILTLILCLALVAALSVAGTLAYLTSDDTVTNTFSVGKIEITMDESKTNEYGKVEGADRVKGNKYLLVPGHTYTKDPTVHVKSDSESAWLFVRITNGLAAKGVEGNETIASQIVSEEYGWTKLEDVDNVYYKAYKKYVREEGKETPAYIDVPVFGDFTVADEVEFDFTQMTEEEIEKYIASLEVKVEAFAIQSMELKTADEAWEALGVKVQ